MPIISSLPLKQSLMVKALNARNPFQFVVETQNVYNNPTLAILYAMNGWKSEQINTDKYERGKTGNLAVAAAIDTVTQSGNDLIIALKDPTYNNFRVGDEVRDSNDYKAIVKSKQPGQVVLEAFTSGALSSASHFKKDYTISVLGNASPSRASKGIESLYVTPDTDYNCYNVVRDSLSLATEDLNDTYVKFRGQNWHHSQEWFMLNRLTGSVTDKMIWGERGYQIPTSQGLVNSNGGIVWSIQNRGGLSEPILSDQISVSKINEIVSNIKVRSGRGLEQLTFVCGMNALTKIQMALSDYIKYAGVDNTFGGTAVKGLSVPYYNIGFVQCKFIHDPMLDNPGKYNVSSADATQIPGLSGSKKSNSFFVIDTSPVNIIGGGKEPMVKMFHFHKEMSYGYIKGMTDAGNDNYTEADYVNATSTDIATDLDARSCHAIVRTGINIVDASTMYYYNVLA